MKRLALIIIYILGAITVVQAQITGKIVDEHGEPVSFASAMYKGHHIAAVSDIDGNFSIERHNGWELTLSCVGFRSQTIMVTPKIQHLNIKLKEDSRYLNEVVVKTKHGRYNRKNNPAVELMKRVIAAKKETKLENHDFYQYNKYQKITMSLNNIKADSLNGILGKPWVREHIELSPYNNKLILPVSVDETVSQHIYRKDPSSEKDIIKAQRSDGLNNLLETGDILNAMLKEVFTDVDLYDNYIRLLQFPFLSPIGDGAVNFYRYYIMDTVYVDRDLCYHLEFMPNNQQDFGFRGEIYILADSTLHVKRCELTIPRRSDVNWVKSMKLTQEYTKLSNGEWVLSIDDMATELEIISAFSQMLVVRNTRLTDYAFDELPKQLFRGNAKVKHDVDALIRDEAYWNQYRAVELTPAESSMDAFIHRVEQSKNYAWLIFFVRAFVENYVETGSMKTKSKFDFGPVNTVISNNFVDGYRLRASGRTTAHLNKHLFWEGFYAYGTKSHKSYYDSRLTYSLNRKKNVPFEFPQRNIIFESSYDLMSPADKFLVHNKDNMFMSLRVQKVRQMYFYNRQKLTFNYETDWGLRYHLSLKAESNEPTGDLYFQRMANNPLFTTEPLIKKIRTTELTTGLTWNPGQTYINTKQRRMPLNFDSPEITFKHTTGFKGFLGGDYRLNISEISLYKRCWLGSWGNFDIYTTLMSQWNRVPFPLLLMPPANLTLLEETPTVSMVRNMEFLMDRYAFWSLSWNMNGKILNRIPLVRKLKWREYIAFKGFFGDLTSKNNPALSKNHADATLMQFPDNAYTLKPGKPYMEMVVGVHNIFNLFAIDWVHRFNYLNHTGVKQDGVRVSFDVSF